MRIFVLGLPAYRDIAKVLLVRLPNEGLEPVPNDEEPWAHNGD